MPKYTDEYIGLKNIDVFVETNDDTYFQIYQLDAILPYGKSSFLIDIKENTFVYDTNLKIEISNKDNEVIYSEVPKYIEGKLRRVSIWTYPTDTDGEYNINCWRTIKCA